MKLQLTLVMIRIILSKKHLSFKDIGYILHDQTQLLFVYLQCTVSSMMLESVLSSLMSSLRVLTSNLYLPLSDLFSPTIVIDAIVSCI